MVKITDTVIARNISGGFYEVTDLRIGWADTESVILTERFEPNAIRFSEDLEWAVANDKVVLNNGTEDVPKADALAWFAQGYGGSATLDEDGNIPPDQFPPSVRGFWIAPGGDQQGYISAATTTWEALRYILFDGTDHIGEPTSVDFLVSTNTPDGNGALEVRLVHEEPGVGDTILIQNPTPYTSAQKGIINVPVSTPWPTDKSIVRLDLRKAVPGATASFCHSVKIIY